MKTRSRSKRLPILMGLAMLLGLLWGVGLSGCTLVYPCGAGDSEYCVGDDCQCGSECTSTEEDCSGDDGCVAYQFEGDHGVCLDRSFMESHDLVPKEYEEGIAVSRCRDFCNSECVEAVSGEAECHKRCDDIETAEMGEEEPKLCLFDIKNLYDCWSESDVCAELVEQEEENGDEENGDEENGDGENGDEENGDEENGDEEDEADGPEQLDELLEELVDECSNEQETASEVCSDDRLTYE